MAPLLILAFVYYDLAAGRMVGEFVSLEDCMRSYKHTYAQREKHGEPLPDICIEMRVPMQVRQLR